MTGTDRLWYHAWPITRQISEYAFAHRMQWLVVGPGSMAGGWQRKASVGTSLPPLSGQQVEAYLFIHAPRGKRQTAQQSQG